MIVLDTHAWVWLVSDPKFLSARARSAIDQAIGERAVLISCISAWEVALLVARGRLKLTMDAGDWIARSEALPFLRFVAVDSAIAVRSVNLPGRLRADPADRIIAATALTTGAKLITRDRRLRRYRHLETVW